MSEKTLPTEKETASYTLPSVHTLFSESVATLKKSAFNLFVLNIIGIFAYIAYFVVFGLLALFIAIPTGVFAYLSKTGTPEITGVAVGAFVVLFILFFIGLIILGTIFQNGFLLIVGKAGEAVSFGDILKTSYKKVWPVLIGGFFVSVLVFGGFFVFIIPAILFSIFTMFVLYEVVVGNETPRHAIKTSITIVQHHFWDIIIRSVLLWVIGMVLYTPYYIVSFLSGWDPESTGIAILSMILAIVYIPVGIAWSWFNISYSVTLYHHAKKATDLTTLGKTTWMWIVAGIGWVIALLLTIGIIVGSVSVLTNKDIYERIQNMFSNEAEDNDFQSSPAQSYLQSGSTKLQTASELATTYGKDNVYSDSESEQIQKLINDAIDDFQTATTVDPENYITWYYLGEGYAKLVGITDGAESSAIQAYKKAIELNPNDYITYMQIGSIYYRLGDDDTAIEYYQKSIDLNPEYATAYYNLGLAHKMKGNTVESKKAFQKAFDLTPTTDPFRETIEKEI